MNSFFINPELKKQTTKEKAASYIRKEFVISKPFNKVTIILTACGIYKAFINSNKIDDQIFLPGFTDYAHRLQYNEYDITHLINQGKNAIGAIVGEGWYRGRVGINDITSYYGKSIKFLCVLNIDYADGSKGTIHSDSTWKATQQGPIRYNDMKGGETYDANKELVGWNSINYNDSKWHQVQECEYTGKLVSLQGERIIEHEHFSPKLIQTPDGSTVLDFGQNLFGYVEFNIEGKSGERITLTHGEVLDENGNFTLKNITAKHKTFQRITYILKDGKQSYKPIFSAHGFRYVKITDWKGKIVANDFKSIAVYSDMEQTGTFVCSNPLINKLVDNVRWSQKSNFLDIPTDCPTRERAGWTGDISVFCETGSYLMNTYKFLNKWLNDVSLQQFKNGILPNTVPNVMMPYMKFLNGSAGWCDAIITVPYTLYKMYGDKSVLEKHYESMVKWNEFCQKRATHTKWLNLYKTSKSRKYIIDTGFHWGEWLEPNHIMSLDATKSILIKSDEEVATAYFAYTSKLLSEIANILGKVEDSNKFQKLYSEIKLAYNREFVKNGTIKSTRQCKYVRPIAMGLVDKNIAKELSCELNNLVCKNNYKIGTGFLTTAWVTKVLSDSGYVDTAFKLLENTRQPGWLYPITKGATTTWENWNGIDSKGIPTNSQNHYAPGSIVAWLFNSVAGIKPLEPGFKKILIKPTVGGSLKNVECTYKTAYGLIIVKWNIENKEFVLNLTVPTQSVIVLPNNTTHTVDKGEHRFTCDLYN